MNDAHAEIRKAVYEARDFPRNTCPSSRHAESIGDHLVMGMPYPMLADEGPYCGESILYTVKALYEARTKIAALLAERDALYSALDRLAQSYRLFLSGKQVRDVPETLAEVDSAIAASGAGKERP